MTPVDWSCSNTIVKHTNWSTVVHWSQPALHPTTLKWSQSSGICEEPSASESAKDQDHRRVWWLKTIFCSPRCSIFTGQVSSITVMRVYSLSLDLFKFILVVSYRQWYFCIPPDNLMRLVSQLMFQITNAWSHVSPQNWDLQQKQNTPGVSNIRGLDVLEFNLFLMFQALICWEHVIIMRYIYCDKTQQIDELNQLETCQRKFSAKSMMDLGKHKSWETVS